MYGFAEKCLTEEDLQPDSVVPGVILKSVITFHFIYPFSVYSLLSVCNGSILLYRIICVILKD